MVTMVLPTMVMDMVWDMPTMDTMNTHMLTMDITMARDLLMLKPMLMLTMVPMDMDMVLPTMVMDMAMDMPTTDTMDTHMLTTDTTMARDPLMLRLMLMLDTVMDTMLMATMDMPTTDTMDTHMLMVTM